MIDASQVSAVLVTRGDVDLTPILEVIAHAGIEDVVVWDNSVEADMQVYGRYQAINQAKHQVIYTQDDDAICPVRTILGAYHDDELLVNVAPDEKPWLAWGAVFTWNAWQSAIERYMHGLGRGQGFLWPDEVLRWADVIFSSLTEWRAVDLGHQDLPHAFAENRMYRMPDHYSSQELVEQRCVELGGTVRRA